jgi:hypothetical protein
MELLSTAALPAHEHVTDVEPPRLWRAAAVSLHTHALDVTACDLHDLVFAQPHETTTPKRTTPFVP